MKVTSAAVFHCDKPLYIISFGIVPRAFTKWKFFSILTNFFCCPYRRSECLQKFGPALGEEVWEAVNAVFDVLPLAAIVDNKVKKPEQERNRKEAEGGEGGWYPSSV